MRRTHRGGKAALESMLPANPLLARYNLLLESSRDIILFVHQRDAMIFEANAAAVRAYGYSRKKLLALSIYDLRAPETHAQLAAQLKRAGRSEGFLFETVHVRKNGSRFPVEVSSRGTLIGDDRVYISIVRDITERKKAEQQLREGEENLRVLLDASGESFFLMDTRGLFLAANEAVARRMGFEHSGQLIGKRTYDLLPPGLARKRKAQVARVIQTGRPVRFEDTRRGRIIDQAIYPVFDESGRVTRIAVYGTDITDYRNMEERLRVLALTDQLTGLYNRRGFYLFAERQLKVAKRSGQILTLFYIDLDGMKKINDTLGHDEGDRALLAVADILSEAVRESDIVARVGGDEFTVLAINTTEAQGSLIDRLMERIRRFNLDAKEKFTLSLSIGTAVYNRDSKATLQELVTEADKRMYREKRRKRAPRGM